MPTQKLYYKDCHLQSFSATVTGCREAAGGYAVTLDATAFYPEGGGQACDVGSLGSVRVLDVQEQDEEVIHLCDGPLVVGQTVEGKIDYEKRFDLMQQHTGEHILSGIIHKRLGYHNAGFHVGAQVMEVDFDGIIPGQELAEIELEANRTVWADLPVRCWYPTPEELPTVQYRTKRALPWPVRVVEIPGTDACACCGVHVAHTGEVGLIKILSCVKFRQGVRLELVCGQRALCYVNATWEQNRQISQLLSARMHETAGAVQKLCDQLAEEKLRTNTMQRQLFERIAAGYAGRGNVVHFEEDISPAGVRELAQKVAQICGGMAAVFSGEDAAGYSMCLVSKEGDVKELGARLSAALNGRGGGKPGFFQGSVKATKAQIEAFFGI